ncbi:Gfo/Idh/MocA family protein [Actinokineospora globicatena]|uniref:Oxidoreductase n=1 Tax=Actinokineospora globicatena TaxID=103729 RepID=A0A9W6V7J6_9PSEU|nr:Gfo/Idh/MocA family oxidoreductase [Actinokineospora globicatena]MCP2303448.1 putative dehydrogenase [Actinokineospora globicatena]GLW79418.1 oxidoreductase [Actinokineospora globicatena]GLW86172.1 oxidoreductase [Actinokineospora globicatena]GLW90034.1 oxidoreductase [Actinokineospora globicatena]
MTGTTAAPLRIGIVGLSATGGWASRSHVQALAGSDRFTLVGTCASTAESAAKAAAEYGLPVATSSPAALAADDRVDAVVVAVRVPLHEQVLLEVLPVGKPTFCEWPLAPDAGIAATLARLADEHGTPTAVGLQARHVPQVRMMKRLIGTGHIGRVLSARLIGDAGGWGTTTGSATAYTVDGSSGATMAAIPLGHTLDAVVDTLGRLDLGEVITTIDHPEVRVSDTGAVIRKSTPDQIAFVARTATGAVLTVHYQGGLSAGTTFLWEVRGTEGVLRLTGATGHLQFGAVTLRGARHGGELAELVPVAGLDLRGEGGGAAPASVVADQYAAWHDVLTGAVSPHPATVGFQHAATHHELIDEILRRGEGSG